MWIADKYIDHVKEETTAHPGESWDQMLLGFKLNKLRTKLLPKKGISKGYQKLEAMMMSFVADSLSRPESYVWGNIFSPCEIMECFGLNTLSIECLSCYFSGYHLEDFLSIMRRIQGSRRHCVPTTRRLWELLTAGQCRCRNMR